MWKPSGVERRTGIRFDILTEPIDDLLGCWRRTGRSSAGRQRKATFNT